MDETIFPATHQLNDELQCIKFQGRWALQRSHNRTPTLPGQPRISLDHFKLHSYLGNELLLPQLDQLAPKLWLVSAPQSPHVSPLHHQAVRGRTVILTESPELHLVWYYNQIFVKPIPKYLLSHAFWEYLAIQSPDLRKAALGFMRTYSYLVRYEADFQLAQERGLIPRSSSSTGGECEIAFETFARLIAWFDRLDDDCVAPRYSYGELRLTRLNFYTRIFLRKLTFHHIDAQLGTFLNHAIAPFITGFVVISVILNAMQVELAAQTTDVLGNRWAAFASLSRWISVVALCFAAFVMVFVLSLMAISFVYDVWFVRSIVRKKKVRQNITWKSEVSSNV